MRAEYVSLWRMSDPLHLELGAIPDFLALAWPYLLPPLVVFALEGPLSLRVSCRHPFRRHALGTVSDACSSQTWIAVQRSPYRTKGPSSQDIAPGENAQRRIVTYVAPTYLLGITLFGAFLQCGLKASTRAMAIFDSLTLAPLFIYATAQVRYPVRSSLDSMLTVSLLPALCTLLRHICAPCPSRF